GYVISNYAVNWGDGVISNYTTTGGVTHTYTSSGIRNITVSLTDSTGTFTGAGPIPITVNPRPSVAISGNSNANAGGVYSFTLGAVSDPGYSVSLYTVHWGDGQIGTYTSTGLITHTYATNGSAGSISVDLTDATGTFTSAASQAITV